MTDSGPEDVQALKARRDAALLALTRRVPFIAALNISFDRRGDELTAILSYDPQLGGNTVTQSLHGGSTAGFLEVAAQIQLTWTRIWPDLEAGRLAPEALGAPDALRMPKTVDFTVDFLRAGLPRDAYARARIVRAGRRYASVHVEGWQDNRDRPHAHATGHFVLPADDG